MDFRVYYFWKKRFSGLPQIWDKFVVSDWFEANTVYQFAYGCHFNQKMSFITLDCDPSAQNTPNAHVSEPASLFLLATGLIGVAGLGRKKLLKK